MPVVPGARLPAPGRRRRLRRRRRARGLRRRRLSADGQGRVRRRRQGHAAGAGPRAGAWPPARRRRARRAAPSATAPSTSSAISPGRATSSSRSSATATATSCTCSSASVRSSGATRRSSRRRPSPALDDARRAAHGRRRGGRRPRRRLRGRRHRRVPGRPGGRLLLPGDEHPPAGRAPGHRAGHRARTWCCAQILVAGGAPLPWRQEDLTAARPRHRVPRLRRGSRERVPALAGAGCCCCASRRAPACASTAGVRQGDEVSLYYDPMIAKLSVHAADRAGGHRAHGGRPARLPDPRRDDEPRVPAGRAGRSPAFAAGRLHTGFLDEHLPHWRSGRAVDAEVALLATAAAETGGRARGVADVNARRRDRRRRRARSGSLALGPPRALSPSGTGLSTMRRERPCS